jgi:putative ATP-binding cassette transporter
MNLVSFLYSKSPRLSATATLASLASGLCGAAIVAVISEAISLPATPHLAITFFCLCLSYLLTKVFAEISLLHLTQSAILEMRLSLSRKIIATPLKRLQSLGKHGLFAILTKDIETFLQAFQLLPLAFGNVIVISTCLVYLAWTSWQIFLILGACLMVCLVGFHSLERKPLRQLGALRKETDTLYKHLRGIVEGSKELQMNSLRRTMYVDKVIADKAETIKVSFIRAMLPYIWLINIGGVLFYLVIGFFVFIIPLWINQSAPELIGMILVLMYLIRPISELMVVLPTLRQADVALKNIQKLNDELIAPVETSGATFPLVSSMHIQLRDVHHHYSSENDDHAFVLGPLDLDIYQGEIVFIIGGNGSGKTTLLLLLLGLYLPDKGRIILNNTEVTTDNIDAYRQNFAVVFADFHLFDELLIPVNMSVSSRANHYLKEFAIDHRVKIENGKFSTTDLSTGQRKRLALISAYLDDKPIFVFDEWAADQDPVFKRIFYTQLLPDLKSRGKTVIVISHDDEYFSAADRVIKLESGRTMSNFDNLRTGTAS